MPGPLRSFHAFDDTTKNNIEFAFLEKFRYRDGEDVQRCREVLEAIAAKRYSGELHEARNNCIKKFGRNILAWKKSVPHWCLTHAYWHGLCDIFATDEWQEVSKQNHDNRTTSGLTVSHYAGCASAHQHFGKLKNLKNGEDPTMRELYIHLHCRRDNGKSPIETQLEAATPVRSVPAEITDDNGVMDPNTEEIPRVIEELDVNSLQFPNTRIKAVYEKVNDMMAEEAHADMDETTMFMSAAGGASHGRVLGFGSMVDGKVQTATNRSRPKHTASSVTVSGVTTNGVQASFSRTEVQSLLDISNRRQAEDRAEMKRELASYQMCINQLFSMFGAQGPNQPGQGPTQPTQEVASHMQMGNFRGNASPIQPNQGFEALLNQANTGIDDVPTNEAAMGQWCGDSAYNGNHPF
ncbi:hypothetical protein FCM35_KLT19380 [Carex littledalei]|uniref:Uncharacterized protein n=1 Tax=Carex littledalei TaxID=544730 RepID=A0A833VXQ0_9POAL|nr:hypothetical protein FCM35_KLT19380 [Carex littledalei]